MRLLPKLGRWRASLFCAIQVLAPAWLGGSAAAETIALLGPSIVDRTKTPTFSVAIRLFDNESRLIGYTLNVDINGQAGSEGHLEGDASGSSFFEAENLIVAAPGGGTLDPVWSLIIDPGDNGVFINAVNEGFVSVDVAGPGHDALAEVLFHVPPDALGDFTVYVGPGSILMDETLQEVPFGVEPLHVQIVPEPAAWGLISAIMASLWCRTSRSTHRGAWPGRQKAISGG